MQNDQLKISGATSGATLLKISQQPSNESLKVPTGVPFSSQPGSKKKNRHFRICGLVPLAHLT